ncbi:MAG: acyl carrier protein [Gemmatimonadetes bacterium]|nr:acyl carrier protein [Gemmatimonadota bacterium]
MENPESQVLELVCRIGKLSGLSPRQDIFDAGFESIDSLELLVELEAAFDVSIPDEKYVECRTAEAIAAMIAQLAKEAGR